MRDIVKHGLILLIITTIAAFVLGLTNDVTQGIIVERAELKNIESIKALLPEAEEFKKIENVAKGIIVEVYEGTKGGSVVGYTVKSIPRGYGGTVETLVGMSKDGKIVGLKIGEHTETPGLGSKIADAAFVNKFIGKDAIEFNITKDQPSKDADVQTVSGATVSSKAVSTGVNASTELFNSTLKNR